MATTAGLLPRRRNATPDPGATRAPAGARRAACARACSNTRPPTRTGAFMIANPAYLILFGVVVGVFSGVMGLGGGAVMIPIMVLLLAMDQPTAHGTSLAVMIPPVTL